MEGTGLTVRDIEIKKDVLKYRDRLSDRVIASDLLRESPSIKFHLGSRVVEKIERVEDRDGITAAADAFWSHMEESTSTGIWSSLYNHLKNNGYLRILKIVNGHMTDDDLKVDEQHMTALEKIYGPLSVEDLIGRLVQKKVLLPIHSEKILAKRNVPSDATKLMFAFLKRSKSIEWFELFLKVVGRWDKEKANEIRELAEGVKRMRTQRTLLNEKLMKDHLLFSQPHIASSKNASSTFEISEVDSLSSDALEVSCDEDDSLNEVESLSSDALEVSLVKENERTFSHVKFDRIISKVELGQGIIPRKLSCSL